MKWPAWLTWYRTPVVPLPAPEPPKAGPVVAPIIDLLQRFPEDWQADQYKLKHTDGMQIWIANGPWAIHVEMPKRGHIVHQTTPSQPSVDQLLLWAAINDWKHRGSSSLVQEYVAIAETRAFERWRKKFEAATDEEIARINKLIGERA